MAKTEELVADHYGISGLFDKIVGALADAGVPKNKLTMDDLKPVDEFHIGGVAATKALLDPIGLAPGSRILDIGSGLGGPARFMAQRYGAKVTGVDLTPEFVETAQKLTEAVGLDVGFTVGSALDLPFEQETYDVATLLHVGMNLPNKSKLFAEAARVLGPTGRFVVYDVMQFGANPNFPVPWAEAPEASFLATPDDYLAAAGDAGFSLVHRSDRGEVACAFFAEMQARMAAGDGPVVGVPLLMGENAPEKAANMRAAVEAGDIQPVEMIFEKGPSA